MESVFSFNRRYLVQSAELSATEAFTSEIREPRALSRASIPLAALGPGTRPGGADPMARHPH